MSNEDLLKQRVELLAFEKKSLADQLKQLGEELKKKETTWNHEKVKLEQENLRLNEKLKANSSRNPSILVEKENFNNQIIEDTEKLKAKIQKLEQENSMMQEKLGKVAQDEKAKQDIIDEQITKIQELENQLKVQGYEQTGCSYENQRKASAEFYAGIIDIPNMKKLVKGWEITISNWQEYQNLTQKKGTVVSVIGNYNRGKTYMLELLTDNVLPKGFNVNTQGISILYLKDKENKQKPVVALDTKGCGSPLNIGMSEDDEKLDDDSEQITEKLRDRGATEDLMQNFILDQASIILVVVGDLTFDDQKLVNKVINKAKTDISKKIIVVHNLLHTQYLEEVDLKIDNTILTSFNLEEVEFKEPKKGKNHRYFIDQKRGNIPHLILSKQYTVAGNYYNESAIEFIKQTINSHNSYRPVDVIKAFHEYMQENLNGYMEADRKIEKDDVVLIMTDNNQPVGLRLENVENVKMKQVLTDVFGDLHVFKNGFCPYYTLCKEIIEKEEYLCLRIECPDCPNICDDVLSCLVQMNQEFKIRVKGNKKGSCKAEDIIQNNRQLGDFFIETNELEKSKHDVYCDQIPQKEYKDGMCILRWKMKKEKSPWV